MEILEQLELKVNQIMRLVRFLLGASVCLGERKVLRFRLRFMETPAAFTYLLT